MGKLIPYRLVFSADIVIYLDRNSTVICRIVACIYRDIAVGVGDRFGDIQPYGIAVGSGNCLSILDVAVKAHNSYISYVHVIGNRDIQEIAAETCTLNNGRSVVYREVISDIRALAKHIACEYIYARINVELACVVGCYIVPILHRVVFGNSIITEPERASLRNPVPRQIIV